MAKDFYELIDHTGDLGIVVRAPDRKTLFARAAEAMFEQICDTDAVRIGVAEPVHAEGRDDADLLRNWLQNLLVASTVRKMLFCQFTITTLEATYLIAFAEGEPIDPETHVVRREIKAVTYHQLEVRRSGEGWEARVIFDL